MNHTKKAQSMSMNVIIVAVIALIVLVVLLYIFGDKINIFGKGVSNCNGRCSNGIISDSNSGYEICNNEFRDQGYSFNPAGVCGTKTQPRACCVQPLGPQT